MKQHFRKNAGVVVFNTQKKVLMCRRIVPQTDGWQFPQGGIEQGETPLQAAKRELFEETSIKSVVAVKTLDYALRYEFPESVKQKFRSQGILSDGQDLASYPQFEDRLFDAAALAVRDARRMPFPRQKQRPAALPHRQQSERRG